MRKRTVITEADKLKEARAKAQRFSALCDEEIAKGEPLDREMFCAAMGSWQSAMKEIFRIENDERLAKIKKESEQIAREQYNHIMLGL